MPQVTLHYHALLREKIGAASEAVDIPEPATADAVLKDFLTRYPQFRPLEQSLKIAVNETIVTPRALINAGDRVDLLPPFGGG